MKLSTMQDHAAVYQEQVTPTKPIVSVVIPTYNHGEFLGRALDSILSQQGIGENFEVDIIVVDDASTDATSNVVRLYRQIRYLRLPHRQGVSAAMNAGIQASTGQYVSILGADDAWLPHKLSVQLPLLIANPQVGVVYGQAIRRVGNEEELFPDASRAPSGWVFEPMLTYSFAGHFASLLVRREAFDRVGYFDESLVTYEDYEMSLRLALEYQFLFQPGPVTIYNLNAHGLWLTQTASGAASRDLGRVIERTLQKVPDSPRYERVRKETPIRVALQSVAPFMLVGEPTQAWTRLTEVLRVFPSSGRSRLVRNNVRWIARKKLSKASSPLVEARDMCAQIRDTMSNASFRERWHLRWILAEIWTEVLTSERIRNRVSLKGMRYAAIRAIIYAPSKIALVRRLSRGSIEKVKTKTSA